MSITIVFFASIRETLGLESLQTALPEIPASGLTVESLTAVLTQQNPSWRGVIDQDNVLVAVNQTMVAPDHPVSEGDEVAYFPPVTGG